jgi:hypothetical protein
MTDNSNLKREIQPMPDDIREALEQRDLIQAYEARPAYQRNDYLGWIARDDTAEAPAADAGRAGGGRRLHEHAAPAVGLGQPAAAGATLQA